MLSGMKYNNLIKNYTLDVGGVLTKFDNIADACQYTILDHGVFKMQVASAEKFEWYKKLKSGLISKAKSVNYLGSGYKVFTLAKYSEDRIRLVEYNVPAVVQYLSLKRFSVRENNRFIAVYVSPDRYTEAVNMLPIWLYYFDLECIGLGDGGDQQECDVDLDQYPDFPFVFDEDPVSISYRLFKPNLNYKRNFTDRYSSVIAYMKHNKIPDHLHPSCHIRGDYLDITFPMSQKLNFDRLMHIWIVRFGLVMVQEQSSA